MPKECIVSGVSEQTIEAVRDFPKMSAFWASVQIRRWPRKMETGLLVRIQEKTRELEGPWVQFMLIGEGFGLPALTPLATGCFWYPAILTVPAPQEQKSDLKLSS